MRIAESLPEDHWATFADAVRDLDLAGVSQQADRLMQPDHMVWVVVGDRAKIEEGIAGLEIGEIRYLDADGNPVDG